MQADNLFQTSYGRSIKLFDGTYRVGKAYAPGNNA